MDALLTRPGGRRRFLKIPPSARISAIRRGRIPARAACWSSLCPQGRRTEAVPCRFIQLTKEGQSVEDFYRTGTQEDMEEALAGWLRAQIERIEQERGLSPKQGAA